MRKILAFSYISILFSIILSSCSSNVSITKRRYTKGYYVEHVTKPNIVNAFFKPESHLLSMRMKIASQQEPEFSNQLVIEKTVIEPILPSNRINIAVNKAPQENTNNRKEINAENEDQQTTAYNSGSAGGEGGEHAALSLLWIVIVVILILWLIGLLAGGFGLGGLINILLIVALILLILWLLRVL